MKGEGLSMEYVFLLISTVKSSSSYHCPSPFLPRLEDHLKLAMIIHYWT